MGRRLRSIVPGVCYHVVNRGNNRATVFHGGVDYRRFLQLVEQAQAREPLAIIGACLMPNHFHLLVRPSRKDALSSWLHRVQMTHSHRHHRRFGTSGRVWQGRYKAFPVQQDRHLLVVLRYVERNALRAGLVRHASDWPWGSAAWRAQTSGWGDLLTPSPVALPADWLEFVDRPHTPAEIEALRACGRRQRPYGEPEWAEAAPECLAFQPAPSGRARGRPRKTRPADAAE